MPTVQGGHPDTLEAHPLPSGWPRYPMEKRNVLGVRMGSTQGTRQSAKAQDELHSADESREIILGHSRARRLLLVCFTEREMGRVRIISGHRATSKESHDYEESVQK